MTTLIQAINYLIHPITTNPSSWLAYNDQLIQMA